MSPRYTRNDSLQHAASLPPPLKDSQGSGGPRLRRRKLTQKNLKLLQRNIDQEGDISSLSPTNTNSRGMPLSTQSYIMEISALSKTTPGSGRAYAATDIRFENALRALNIKFARREVQPDADDVKAILDVMEKGRQSPEPDSVEFYETLSLVQEENESAVIVRLTPLLIPLRDRASNNHKTKDLLYRFDTQWRSLGSLCPRFLPIPKPDLCITFNSSAFSFEEQEEMDSLYPDGAGFYPAFVCEVKTAMQGDASADRQNANNAICALEADFLRQQRLGRETERKIRLITTAHNTNRQWYTGWFYVLGANGRPEWCSKLLKSISFAVEEENGFSIARRINLNLSERIQHTVLPQLRADVAEILRSEPGSISEAANRPDRA
ncbi:MAG: hypothetical protein FRX48_04358 [Lasallia pustulata]|uniref:DUF7924 domain-containing protein n=1 Tax=Lasallia pustulata TaxID=136370 RepID=A0A5M8PU56_9LECA|nr:MAG: hypothetical protein FRX48_04358 [Lasallia pustulata]